MGYTRVYINIHPDYDYSTAMIQRGWIEGLESFLKDHEWLHYEAPRRVTIQRRDGSELSQFIEYVRAQGATVYTRDKRSDEWEKIPESE